MESFLQGTVTIRRHCKSLILVRRHLTLLRDSMYVGTFYTFPGQRIIVDPMVSVVSLDDIPVTFPGGIDQQQGEIQRIILQLPDRHDEIVALADEVDGLPELPVIRFEIQEILDRRRACKLLLCLDDGFRFPVAKKGFSFGCPDIFHVTHRTRANTPSCAPGRSLLLRMPFFSCIVRTSAGHDVIPDGEFDEIAHAVMAFRLHGFGHTVIE